MEPETVGRRRSGFSLIELLVLIAVLAITFTLAATEMRGAVRRTAERAGVNTLQQAVWQGATLAAARGFRTELVRAGQELRLQRVSDGSLLRRFEFEPGVVLNLPDGQVLVFTPPGTVLPASLAALPDPVEIQAGGTTYRLDVSLIGEVRVR